MGCKGFQISKTFTLLRWRRGLWHAASHAVVFGQSADCRARAWLVAVRSGALILSPAGRKTPKWRYRHKGKHCKALKEASECIIILFCGDACKLVACTDTLP